jgi:hypothetical protein
MVLLFMQVTTFNIVDAHVRPFRELQNIFRYHGYVSHSNCFLIYFLTEEKLGNKLTLVRTHAHNNKITDIFRVTSPKGTLFCIYYTRMNQMKNVIFLNLIY